MADKPVTADMLDKYRRVAEHFVMYGEKSEALKYAGYSDSYIKSKGYTIFAREDVKAYIEEFRSQVLDRNLLTADKVVNEMAKIAFVDVTEVVKVVLKKRDLDDYTTQEYIAVDIKPTDQWTPEQRAAIKSIKYTRDGIAVEFYSKPDMLIKLGETLGIFKQNLNINGQVNTSGDNPFEGLSLDELKALAAGGASTNSKSSKKPRVKGSG
jgi:phage terminase small subunit